ncbi:MAG: response regulator [Candidatus Rokubacteria bacterium]|nr:response regulator [Candidatus Rokubacteria bacterium]
MRVLLIEPEPHAREGLRAILSAEGHEVSVAEDIPAGFARLSSEAFGVLLLDADLPPSRNVMVTVLDLLRLARRGDPGVRGILIASCVEDVPGDLAAQGVLAVLEKPVELSRLRLALEAAASRQGQRSAV